MADATPGLALVQRWVGWSAWLMIRHVGDIKRKPIQWARERYDVAVGRDRIQSVPVGAETRVRYGLPARRSQGL